MESLQFLFLTYFSLLKYRLNLENLVKQPVSF